MLKYENIGEIDPYIRMMRGKKSYGLTGKWRDLDHVFTYIATGTADFIIDGVSYTLSEGDVILFPPLVTHMIIQHDQQLLTQYIFHFDLFEDSSRKGITNHDILGKAEEVTVPQRELLMRDEITIAHFPEEMRQEFLHQYLLMRGEFQGKRYGREYFLKQYCRLILAMAIRAADQRETEPSGKKMSWALVEKTVNYLNTARMDEDLSNASIAAKVGVSPNYLTRSFSECLGVSLHHYIVMVRMERAQKLLLSGEYNITEAARKTGYSNIFVFSKAFKKYTGVSPSYFIEHSVNIEQENMSMINHDSEVN